jgi:predicted TIM-barrel fold metal-dependent hydrolase
VFDAHFHVIEPGFPLLANEGYVPDAFGVDDYLAAVGGLGVTGGAVVAGSFQGVDQTWLVAALDRLGPAFVGVAQLAADVTDDEIVALDERGVRAVRANLRRGMASFAAIDRLARRVHEVAGWHLEIYADASALDVERVARLPHVVLDHLGLTTAGLGAVVQLAERGHHVKATGFGRTDLDVPAALADIAAANPGALVFGTDLPSTRNPRPFARADLDLTVETLGPHLAELALVDNARALYRLTAPGAR